MSNQQHYNPEPEVPNKANDHLKPKATVPSQSPEPRDLETYTAMIQHIKTGRESSERINAIKMMGSLGKDAREALETLDDAAKNDPNSEVRSEAKRAATEIRSSK